MKRIAVILFLVFILAWMNQVQKMNWVNFNWFNIPNPEELYLLEYPKNVSGEVMHFEVYSSKKYPCSVFICNATVDKTLTEGYNTIEVGMESCGSDTQTILLCGESLVRFYSHRINSSFSNESIDAKFSAATNKRTLRLDVNFTSKLNDAAYKNFEVKVDGNSLLRPTYLFRNGISESHETEELSLEPGQHTIELSYAGRTLDTKSVSIDAPPFPYIDVVNILLSAAIALVVYREYSTDWLTSFLLFFGASFSALALQLQLHNNLGFSEWIVPFLLALGVVLLWNSKKKQAQIDVFKAVRKEAIIFGVVFTAVIAALVLKFGPVDWWGAYYYRNVQTALEEGNTLFYDKLSYLGRNFTYPPVFFQIASEVSLLLGQYNYESIRLPFHLLAVFVYSVSLYLLFRKFKRWQERVAGATIFATHAFVMIFSSTVTLHVLAYSFMNLSLLLMERKENMLKILSAVFLSFALSAHPTCILLFPVYVYAMGLFKIDWKRISDAAVILISASAISLIFYMPIFMRNGLPYETAPTLWGYFVSYGFIGLVYDLQFLIPIALITALFGVVKKPLQLAVLLLVLAVLANALVAFRINLIIAIMLSFLFPLTFGEELKDSYVMSIFFLFILANLFFIPVLFSGTTTWCEWVYANDMCVKPMRFIDKFTSTSDSVAINPEYGHIETYVGQRKVLADLYVEYAPSDKFYAEYNFYNEQDIRYLQGYNISLMVLDDNGRMRDLAYSDRIYDNSFIHMYR
ncbi:hypothetical protein H0N98_02355 [Candidatus Micrarchaeota archaeon]|nr:hypothetical protein [Candidatus Micrarchaeota archaeon]